MWAQETCRMPKSQQIRKSLIYMCCSKATCPPSNHENGFTANDGLGHTHSQLHQCAPHVTHKLYMGVCKCLRCHKTIMVISSRAYCIRTINAYMVWHGSKTQIIYLLQSKC